MDDIKFLLAATSLFACVPADATTVLALGPDLQSISAYSRTAITTGAGAVIFGNLLSGGAGTAGASSTVWGDYTTAGAATLGASSKIASSVNSGGAVTSGAFGFIGGNITAGGAATLAADSITNGTVKAAAAVTVGATAFIGGSVLAGAAATIGAGTSVIGSAGAVAAITLGAGATVGSTQVLSSPPVDGPVLVAALSDAAGTAQIQIAAAQNAFRQMTATNFLPATIAVDISLAPGVYSANSLTTAASTTLTLDGGGLDNQFWVFNINDNFTMGASNKIVLIGGATNNSIIWNTGGFTSLGANSLLLGTLLSNSYISIGANTSIFGNGTSCGGAFSALSYLVIAANSVIGKSGCSGVDNGFRFNDRNEAVFIGGQNDPVLEPQTWALFLIGFLAVGFAARRKQSIPSVC